MMADVRPSNRTNPSTWRKIKYSSRSDTSGSCPTSDHRWSAPQTRLLAPHIQARHDQQLKPPTRSARWPADALVIYLQNFSLLRGRLHNCTVSDAEMRGMKGQSTACPGLAAGGVWCRTGGHGPVDRDAPGHPRCGLLRSARAPRMARPPHSPPERATGRPAVPGRVGCSRGDHRRGRAAYRPERRAPLVRQSTGCLQADRCGDRGSVAPTDQRAARASAAPAQSPIAIPSQRTSWSRFRPGICRARAGAKRKHCCGDPRDRAPAETEREGGCV